VPDDKLMILDIGNDRYPDSWRTAHAFGGKPWIYGYVHNYGGSNPVYGDLDYYRADLAALTASPDTKGLAGFGMFPEGLSSNSIVYERPTTWPGTPAERRARHGFRPTPSPATAGRTPALEARVGTLVDGAYSTRYWTPRWWNNRAGAYLFFKRPTTTITGFEAIPVTAPNWRSPFETWRHWRPGSPVNPCSSSIW
jgi:alpha-N-acetylglucosaminidase